jgi:PUA domain protein
MHGWWCGLKKSLSKREIEPLNAELGRRLGSPEFLTRKDRVELSETDGLRLILRNGIPAFIERDGRLIPHLKLLLQQAVLKKVTVDMGAIRFITAGADVMRPGITAIDDGIRKDDLVAVVDQQHGKPLAVGLALGSTEELRQMTAGKAVKSLHWIGDKAWKAEP